MKEKVLLLLILVYFIHSVDAFGDEEIIFLHHSTGNNVYNYPALGVSQWFSNYNLAEGTSYQINEASYPTTPYPWNNYPYDYWHLWVDGYCDNGQSGIRCLDYFTTNYDVVIWKHCYPGSDIFQEAATGIPSDRTIENYKSQYRLFRAEMDNYPNTKFIVWTIPPRREADTNLGNAQRTVQFTNWVKNEWLTEGGEQHPNIYLFDFRSIVSDSNGYYLKPEYESADSHPNADANNIAGPLFAEFIVGVTNVDVTNNGELIWKEDFEDQSYTDTFSTHESSTTCAEGSNGYDSLSVTDYQSQNGYYSLRFDSCSIAIDPVTGLDGCENINLYLGTLTGSTVGGTSHDFSSIETTNEIYVKYWTRYDNAIPLSEEYLEIGAYDFNDNGYVAFDENSPSQYPLSAKTRDSGWNIIDYTNPLSPLNIYDGNWHKMEYHINYDYNELGEASVSGWIDDQLVLDWQNIITPGTPDYIRVHKFLEGASECTSSPVQIDDIEVWDGIPNLAQCADGEIFSLCECGGSARDYGYCLANEWATNPIISCTINDAYWSETNVDVGTQVDLIVIGTNCDGRTVNFQILEHDAIIGNYDDVTSQLNNPPNEATFSGNTATVSWISEWVEDNGGIDDDPEYVFIASLSDDLSEFRLSNNELKVNFIEIICTDDDEDNYYVETSSCEAEPGFLGHNDCDDNNEQIYPANVNGYCDCVTDWGDNFDIGAPIDFCEDGIDQNCNGMDETCLANELIVDNDDTSISFSGSWSGGGGYLGKYGDYYHYSAIDPTNWFEWTIDLTSLGAGQYEVYTSWNELSTRPSDVSYDITHSSGTDNLPKDQTLLGSGGVWNYLGTYSFGSTAVVRLNDGTTGSDGSSADAVRFLKISSGCLEDSDCNELDGDDFCFGTEVRHTEGICNASFECEAQTSIVEDCNDGLFCNGLESCNAASCVDGTSPITSDGVGCTDDSCDEINDVIVNYPNDSLCDDSLFCNGIENCDVLLDCQIGIPIDCSSSDLVGISSCFNNPDGIDWTLDLRSAFTSSCQEPEGSCTTGDSSVNSNCDITNCGAECELNSNCLPTDCDLEDGCVGNDYYDYDNVDNDCLEDCSCETNSCGVPTITYDSPLCVACTIDDNCNSLDSDFCFGTEVRHTEGICNASFECEAQTSIVEDCNDGLFCNGLESCNAASCVDGTSPIIEDGIGCTDDSCDEINDVIVNYPNDSLCDDGDEGTIDNCSVVDDCIFTPIITIVDQTIDLNEGWNLVSLNINTSNSSSDLGAVFVMRYGDNSWETDWGIFYEDEFGLDPLRGYYVFSGSDQSLTFSGQELGLDYSLVNNTWNLFSVHSSDSFDSIYETSLESGELMQVVLSDGSFVYSDVSEDLNPGSLYWAKIGDAQFGPVVQSTGFFQGIIDTIMYLFKVNS